MLNYVFNRIKLYLIDYFYLRLTSLLRNDNNDLYNLSQLICIKLWKPTITRI